MQQLLGAGCRSIQVRLNDFKTNANDSMPRKLQLKVNYFVHSRLKIRKAAITKINNPFIHQPVLSRPFLTVSIEIRKFIIIYLSFR